MMSYSRGDPLAGWKQENLAAPKPAAQQDYGYQATVYDDRPPVPMQASGPASSDPLEGWQEHNLSAPQDAPEAQSCQQSIHDHSYPASASSPPPPRKTLTDAEKSACPKGDTRWPPPKTPHAKPLQLLLDDKGSARIYYHLIHKNPAPEAKFWKKEILSKAQAFFAQNFPPREPVDIANQSAQQVQEAQEQAAFEEQGRLRNAIMTAKLQRRLRQVSTGPRGTIWLLEEESVEVWKCIEVLQKGDSDKCVRIQGVGERFEIFGVGLKAEKDHVLLVSQSVG
ncbi:hypothetical protein NX059_001989 [Plenodomus lindquistii]|nr:hypothetical protein NX059_001989 [Plenodomus lindquistii]